MGISLRRARLVVLGLTLGVLLGFGTGVLAQVGPFTAQIQLLLNSANSWAGLQTFPGGITVTGTCTGCGGGGGTPGGALTSIQYNNAGAFGGFGTWAGSLLTIPGDLTAADGEFTDSMTGGNGADGYVSIYPESTGVVAVEASGVPAAVSISFYRKGAGNFIFDKVITLPTQTANTIFSGPTSGGDAIPAFRAIVDADVPDTITIAGTNNVTWASLNKTGSALADLATRIISNLQASASSELLGVLSDETGTGVAVFATSPTLVTPILGTPQSIVLTNATGTAASLTAGTASAVAVGGITGLGTGVGTWLATPSSANLLAALTDETGTGLSVFSTGPTFTSGTAVNHGAAGVSLLDDGDGAITFTGLGNGFDENLIWNFDDDSASNVIGVTSSTGANIIRFTSIDLHARRLVDPDYSNQINLTVGNNIIELKRSSSGIRLQSGASATIGGFGSGAALVANSTDTSGELDVGTITAETSGTVNFAVTWATAPRCMAQNTTTGAATRATTSTTVLTITGAFVTGDNLVWWCVSAAA